MKYLQLIIAMCLVLGSAQALAWGQIGHRVTGAIAQDYLSKDAQEALKVLFPHESLAEISTYADDNRSNPDPFWQKEAGPYHYVTVPNGETYHDEHHAPKQGDAYTALMKFSKIATDKAQSVELRRRAVHFIVHIIGDLHQPLHVGNGTDRGGNDVKLEFFWEMSNLHRVWDSGLIDRKQLSYTEWYQWLSPKITEQQRQAWSTSDPLVYINESQALRDDTYPQSGEYRRCAEMEQCQLSWQYLYDHSPTVKRRLSMAGVRIAAYLNTLFAPQSK